MNKITFTALIFCSTVGLAFQQEKLPPKWKLDTGLAPIGRTSDTWKKYGSLGKLTELPINFRDRSGLQDEIDLGKSLAGHRNDSSKLVPFADKYRKTKSSRDLQRFLIAVISLSENGKECSATYRGGSMDFDFGLAEYVAFRKSIGTEMNVLETKLLILWDNSYFGNPTETYSLYKKLERAGFADRRISFTVISKVMESYMVYHKNADLVKELYDLASKLYSDHKSQKSTSTYAGAMLAMGILKHDKSLFYKGLSFQESGRIEMAKGDVYDRAALKHDKGTQDHWAQKGKELFK